MKRYHYLSKVYAPTLKEDPGDAELASHRLLLRAGMIRKSASGLYSYLPLAWRSLLKIEQIIREEMEAIDAQEMLVPILTDAELWEQSGRWEAYGPELMRITDRHERGFALGPTHEESFTDLVRNELRSYKQLPVTLYQIQDKFRDERRPRFGLMRGREFIMKDGYSFDATVEGMQKSYEDEKNAYAIICERVGLKCLPVVADSGQIGGDTSVEFMALADSGEAEIAYCDECDFAADTEAAYGTVALTKRESAPVEKIHTPGVSTLADLAALLGEREDDCTKALALMDGAGEPWVVFVPGGHDLNDVKAEHAFGAYHLMSEEELLACGLHKGFIGPKDLPAGIHIAADFALEQSSVWISGANEVDYHFKNLEVGRDFEIERYVDVIGVLEGDGCPECGRALKLARGIEVGQVFQLGTKYSESMGALFMDEDGHEKPLQMGCYGIGVSRMLAAVVEQYHDEAGIAFPVPVAPFEVEVVPLDVHDEVVWPVACELAQQLADKNIEVVLDDRKERAGVKFADADLMGFPYQVVCGKRGVKNGTVELKCRATGEREDVTVEKLAELLAERVESQRS